MTTWAELAPRGGVRRVRGALLLLLLLLGPVLLLGSDGVAVGSGALVARQLYIPTSPCIQAQ